MSRQLHLVPTIEFLPAPIPYEPPAGGPQDIGLTDENDTPILTEDGQPITTD